jgi:hypothetical protein
MNLGTKKDHILQGECCPINFEGVMALWVWFFKCHGFFCVINLFKP